MDRDKYREYLGLGEYIPIEDLEVGVQYVCHARNFTVGTWNGKNFDYIRYKFGGSYPDTEQHWDEGAPFGTVKPFYKFEDK